MHQNSFDAFDKISEQLDYIQKNDTRLIKIRRLHALFALLCMVSLIGVVAAVTRGVSLFIPIALAVVMLICIVLTNVYDTLCQLKAERLCSTLPNEIQSTAQTMQKENSI